MKCVPKFDKLFITAMVIFAIAVNFLGSEKMNVTIETSGSLMIAYLIGELDHHSAGDVRTKIDNEISYNKPTHLILDFKNITFMDSSGIGLVMGRFRLMQSYKGTVEIRNVTAQTKKIMELAGLGRIAVISEESKQEFKEIKNEE